MSNHQPILRLLQRLTMLCCVVAGLSACSSEKRQDRVLVFSKTAAFRHSSIAAGIAAIEKLGKEHHFLVDTTEDAEKFNEENLKRYQAVIFLNTTGDVLNNEQQNDFERFIQAGGGYVGIHAAADTEYGWPWYNKLAGAWFESHPMNPNVQKGAFEVVDKNNPATDSLPTRWEREDEFYNFKSINPDIHVLVKIDEKSYNGGKNGADHPMSWYHDFEGGRAFYTSMGHTDQTFSDPLFLKHLWGGIGYALGGKEPKPLNYALVSTQRLPEENRFTKVVLDEKLDEPTELAVLKDGRVLFIQRKGQVLLYNPNSQKTQVIATIPVNTKYNPDKEGKQKEAEDGLLGLAIDPNFDQNGWVYMYFSPLGGDPKNTLCRFQTKDDAQGNLTIDLASKKVMLEVVTQRDECCHTGGSIAFDAKGNLFLSSGDNTNPFASEGYSPSDEQPGRSAWDAQRSSGNTNDLRGKIMRIHPEKDGSYTIPEGNLFAKGTPNTRPEIYVMGNRNPYRISIDQKTGFLYWGEVGPDANKDTLTRGPRGHDEVNQARKAGFYGWPYFVGDNKPYREYDYAAKTPSEPYNAEKPINNSPNNTGLKELPSANKAFIWYPYAESAEFPLVGTGGRNAMAGPVYYQEDFKGAKRAFPDYYNGKLFTYDWIRGWIMAVTMDKEGNLVKMERFMPNYKFSNPIDMQFGPDGDLYMLEYGAGWFKQNDDARLVRIEYNGGNRKPVVNIAADKNVGATPLTVNFTSKGTMDYDKDNLTYDWSISPKTGGTQQKLSGPNPSFTFDKPGVYKAVLTVTDGKGEKATTETDIEAGNEPPVLTFDLTSGNKTFYFPNQSFDYAVKVSDKEDGSLDSGIPSNQVAVSIDYMKEGFDQVEIAQGHRMADASVAFTVGKNLMEKSDCKACHGIETKSIGPAYKLVAQKYKDDKEAVTRLANKVIKGGGGVWGENAMPAHPGLTVDQASDIVRYVLSLANEKSTGTSLPAKGSYTTRIPMGTGDKGAFVLRAAYTDKGANAIPPMTSEKVLVLRNPKVMASTAEESSGTQKFKLPSPPIELVVAMSSGSYIGFHNIDLTGIEQLEFTTFCSKGQTFGGKIEVHLDSPTGQLLGETKEITPTESAKGMPGPQLVKATLSQTSGEHKVYLVFTNAQAAAGQPLFALTSVQFQNNAKGAVANQSDGKTGISMK